MTMYINKEWLFLTSLWSYSFLTCFCITIWKVIFTHRFLVQYTRVCWDAFIKSVYILTRIYELKTYKRKEDEKNKFSNTNLCTISFYFVLMRSEELCIYVFHIQIASGLFLGEKHVMENEFVYGLAFWTLVSFDLSFQSEAHVSMLSLLSSTSSTYLALCCRLIWALCLFLFFSSFFFFFLERNRSRFRS